MKIHFVYPDVNTRYYPSIYHGLASIAAVLESHGHLVSLHHVKKEPSRNEILDVIQREQPDLIGFSSTTNQIQFVELWSRWIKEEFATPIVCGGVHATLLPQEVLLFDGIDIICVGEGEYPMLELAERLGGDIDDIQNLWIKKNDGVVKNTIRPLITPLDELPFPAYDLFDCKQIVKDRKGDLPVLTGRGCPFNCTYCCNHALRNVYKGMGRYVRIRSVDNLLDEIQLLTNKYRVNHLTFVDDVFGLSKKWIFEFCAKYPKRFDMGFLCNMRVGIVDEEILENLSRANCTHISVGVESGNEWLREKVLKRKMTNEQIATVFDTAHSLGIKTTSYNMIGLPYETSEMIEETINLNKRLRPDDVAVFYFYPYPQTELWEISKEAGLLTNDYSTNYLDKSILALSDISKKELDKLYTKFYRYTVKAKIQSFHFPLRLPLRIMSFVLLKLLGKRGITLLNTIYVKYRDFFQFLKD